MDSLVLDIKEVVTRTAFNKGYEVVGIEIFTHLNPINVQILIRHKGGGDVSLDDCELLTGPLSEAFDKGKVLNQAYILEISSPGINESLTNDRDYETFKGFPIEVTFLDPKEKELKRKGLLYEKSKSDLTINLKGKLTMIPLQSIINVRLTSSQG